MVQDVGLLLEWGQNFNFNFHQANAIAALFNTEKSHSSHLQHIVLPSFVEFVVTLNSPIIVDHNDVLESKLIFIRRINVGHIDFWSTLIYSKN